MHCIFGRTALHLNVRNILEVNSETLTLLEKLAVKADVEKKRAAMFAGEKINETEGRAVLHTALRKPKDKKVMVDGQDVVPEVHEVLGRIRAFTDKVRSGAHKGATGKPLTNVICIGIGGSFLGVEFVHEALRTDADAMKGATGRQLKFLANVDPIDVRRALEGSELVGSQCAPQCVSKMLVNPPHS